MLISNSRSINLGLLCIVLLSLFTLANGCTRGEVSPPPPPSSSTLTDPAQQDILVTWTTSGHADTYVLNTEGLNNECADCHSPLNWLPTDKADLPTSCQSCKIPFEVKEPTEPVSEADWLSVECNICHVVEAGGTVSQVSWLNAMKTMPGEPPVYDTVSSNTELCVKCHTDTGTFLYKRDMGISTHTSEECISCHDTHSLEASCTSCHADPIPGHDEEHTNIACIACHDASGLDIGPVEGENKWTTFRNGDPYVSHNLQLEVDCTRCHYANNSWGLSVVAK